MRRTKRGGIYGTANPIGNAIPLSQKGANNGVAPLDANGRVARSRRPDLDVFNIIDYGATGDGTTNDYTAIAAAMTAASSAGGGVVFAPKGTYATGTTIVVPANVVVQGNGDASVFKALTGSQNVFQTSQRNVRFRDFGIDLNKANTTAGSDTGGNGIYWAPVTNGAVGLIAERLHIYDGHSAGIRCFGQSGNNATTLAETDVQVTGCTIEGMSRRSIYISGCTRPRVTGNICRNGGQDGILVLLSRNAYIGSNLVEDVTGQGISPQYFDGLQVSDNTVRRCTLWGIAVGGGDPAKTVNNRYTISGNVVDDCDAGGITNDPTLTGALYTAVDVRAIVSGNTVSNSGTYHGIYLQNVQNAVVIGNECFGNEQDGIQVHGADVALVGNHCWDNATGIRASAVAETTNPDNIMLGVNHCHDNSLSNYDIDSRYTRIYRFDNEALTVPKYTTVARPAAATVPVGSAIYDETLGAPLWSTGSAWTVGVDTVPILPMQSGRWYRFPNCATVSSLIPATGLLRALPKFIPSTISLDRLGAEVTTVGDAGSKVRLGIYADDGTGRPGALVLDAGTIDGDSATVQTLTLSTPPVLTRGWYWFAAAAQVVTTTGPTVRSTTASQEPMTADYTAVPGVGATGIGFSMSGVTGALPSTFGTPAVIASAASIFGRLV